MKTLVSTFIIFFSLLSFSTDFKKGIKINVGLSPAGSFTVESGKIKGRVYLTKSGSILAENIRIPVKTLKTGIDLRDSHLKKKLGFEVDRRAELLLVKASGMASSGVASFKVLDKVQSVPFKFKKISDKYGQAEFSLSLEKFGITGISYMGVGVENIVNVKVVMPFKLKK